MWKTALALAAALLCACRQGPPAPVEIEAGDVCSQCRMALSETRYAAQSIDRDGKVFKFDDIGCLARFYRDPGARRRAAASFVMDFDGRGWVKAERAHYVKSHDIQSPMGSGIIALRDAEAARRHAAQRGVDVLAFEQLVWQ